MRNLSFLLLFVLFAGCDRPAPSPDTDQQVMAALWYQRSAEARALYYQGFQLAELRIRMALDTLPAGLPFAVITDIDETILDNSPSEGNNILDGMGFSQERWEAWTEKRVAKPLPGSLGFSRFLEANGVELFYISNRSVNEQAATIDNLKKYGFPFADAKHVLLKSTTSDKTERRQQVFSEYQVLLLLGDNLNDFTEAFGDRMEHFGFEQTDQYRDSFGSRFIVFPNPMYGNWTKPFQSGLDNPTPTERAENRKAFLLSH